MRPIDKKIVLATGNRGKLREITQMLAGESFEILPQSNFSIPEVPETGTTFVENAIIKARHASKLSGLPAIADDSGIEVDALQGAPGVYSARYAGQNATDQENLDKLLEDLCSIEEPFRTARYQCVMVLMRDANDSMPIICQGTWEGLLIREELGDNGFGYDPIFWLDDKQCTSAQLSPEMKDQLSHRGIALRQLVSVLKATGQI